MERTSLESVTAAAIVIAVLAVAAAAGIAMRYRQMSAAAAQRQSELESELATSRAEGVQLAARAKSTEEQLDELESALAEAQARLDDKAIAAAMWQLELARSIRQWQDVVVPAALVGSADQHVGVQLTSSISHAVERLREEVGVSIRSYGEVESRPAPDIALAALRITEELLALAAKRSDEIEVRLESDAEEITVTLLCQGWEEVADNSERLVVDGVTTMAVELNGAIEWAHGPDSTLRAIASLPLNEAVLEVDDEIDSESATAGSA